MNKKTFTIFGAMLLIFGISIVGCDKDSEDPPAPDAGTKDVYVSDVSQSTNWNYWVVGKSGEQMYMKLADTKPTEVYHKASAGHPGYALFIDNNGFPDKVVMEDHIFLFGNFAAQKMDISVVYPDGNVEIMREIQVATDWNTLVVPTVKSTEDWGTLVLWAGKVVSGISSGIATANSIPAGGMGLNTLSIGSGGAMTTYMSSFNATQHTVHTLSQETISYLGASLGCTDLGCVITHATTGTAVTTASASHIMTKEDEVRLAESLLFTGFGDIQITLTWDTETDIDLWCTDPDGFKIYYSAPNSPSGGELDFDDTDGYGPENIYWPEAGAPAGSYFVQVHYYDSEGPTTNYTVLIQAFGQTNQYQGSLEANDVVDIATFTSTKSGFIFTPIQKVSEMELPFLPKK